MEPARQYTKGLESSVARSILLTSTIRLGPLEGSGYSVNWRLIGCVRRYKVAKDVLILGWDLGLEWDGSNQELHSEIGNSPNLPVSGWQLMP